MKTERKQSAGSLSDAELLEDLRRVAKDLGKSCLSCADYSRHGRFNHNTMIRRFGSWKKAVRGAGLRMGGGRRIDDEALFYNLLAVWVKLGRQPRYKDLHRPLSKYSPTPYEDRFGSWRRALYAFAAWLRWADADENGSDLSSASAEAAPSYPARGWCLPKRRTSRNPSLRQRFRVMLRDHFRCRLCGRSPATCLDLQLVIDHVVPWSKGGETTDDNLQTLCSDCNQGKFDHNGKQPSDEARK